MKYDIHTIEGAKQKLIINLQGLDDYEVYGAISCSCSKCSHIEVKEKTNDKCIVVLPALTVGIHDYQIFVRSLHSSKEFLILQGKVISENRVCDCSWGSNYSNEVLVVDAEISEEAIVEMEITFEKGEQGEKGDKGDRGYSAYEVAVQHGYQGSEEQWIKDFEGAQDAAASAKQSAAESLIYKEGA